jgi:hypothetical protein
VAGATERESERRRERSFIDNQGLTERRKGAKKDEGRFTPLGLGE